MYSMSHDALIFYLVIVQLHLLVSNSVSIIHLKCSVLCLNNLLTQSVVLPL